MRTIRVSQAAIYTLVALAAGDASQSAIAQSLPIAAPFPVSEAIAARPEAIQAAANPAAISPPEVSPDWRGEWQTRTHSWDVQQTKAELAPLPSPVASMASPEALVQALAQAPQLQQIQPIAAPLQSPALNRAESLPQPVMASPALLADESYFASPQLYESMPLLWSASEQVRAALAEPESIEMKRSIASMDELDVSLFDPLPDLEALSLLYEELTQLQDEVDLWGAIVA